MNAKNLYETIINLVFAMFLLLTLFSFIVLNKPFDATIKADENSELSDLTEVPKKADPKLAKGKTLFKNNCATCHNKNLKDDMTGPALGGVSARWAEYPEEDLYQWIRNSQLMIADGHPRAKSLFKAYKANMNAFPNLKDDEIEAMLYFFDEGFR